MKRAALEIINAMNGREKALAAWVVILIIFILINSKTRTSLFNVANTFFNPKILIPFLAMLAYSVLSVLVLRQAGIWDIFLLKDTIFWFFGTATVLFLNTNKASQDPSLFKKILLETFAITILVEFLTGLYSFSFAIEFVLMPFLFLVIAMSALADSRDEYMIVRRPLKVLIAGYGIFILSYSILTAIGSLTEALSAHNLITLVIPSVLTVMYLPFIYLFALVMAYEALFIRLEIFIKDKKLLSFAKWKVIALCHINLKTLTSFSSTTGREITTIKNKKDILAVIQNFNLAARSL